MTPRAHSLTSNADDVTSSEAGSRGDESTQQHNELGGTGVDYASTLSDDSSDGSGDDSVMDMTPSPVIGPGAPPRLPKVKLPPTPVMPTKFTIAQLPPIDEATTAVLRSVRPPPTYTHTTCAGALTVPYLTSTGPHAPPPAHSAFCQRQ